MRWRLGGGSAALTFVILAGVAGVTDVLTDRHISNAFYEQQSGAAQQFAGEIGPTVARHHRRLQHGDHPVRLRPTLPRSACSHATGRCSAPHSSTAPFTAPLNVPAFRKPRRVRPGYVENGYHVDTALVAVKPSGQCLMLYAEPLSNLNETIREVRIYLGVRRRWRARSSRCWPACSWPSARCARSSNSPKPHARSSARATRRCGFLTLKLRMRSPTWRARSSRCWGR